MTPITRFRVLFSSWFLAALTCWTIGFTNAQYDAVAETRKLISQFSVGQADWPQMGGSSLRNCVGGAANIPTQWDVASGDNIIWSVPLGSTTYGNPVVANGRVFVGTNNGGGYVARYPKTTDLGVLLCFSEQDGKFLWQHSSEKLESGKKHDWPDQGICSTPLVDGERLWYVTSRGEVACLDTNGFYDRKNDGAKGEPNENTDEADVIWTYNMMDSLGVSQRYMANCSVTCAGPLLFVCTSQGVDEQNNTDDAPSLICLNRDTGTLVWSDNTPSLRVLHGQWSSPAYAVLGGVGQVLFGAGDGWLYSFDAQGDHGKAKLLWKFDCNPKDSRYVAGGSGNRNHIIAPPVVYDDRVYMAVGEDPEYGEGPGHLWCIEPTKRGDVSPTLVFNQADPSTPIAPKRLQALVEADGDIERDNPNSAMIWHYQGSNPQEFESTMHRACGGPTIKDDLLLIADFSGLVHCLDAKSGQPHWTHDMFAACWAAPAIVDDVAYISDEDGDIAIFKLSTEKELLGEWNMESAVYTTPTIANQRMFISTRNRLFAIGQKPADDK
ncbi:MAG: PQQ-binding-like beta-propeller repeat protein [Pirellulaceae bacterium]|nr:PQQ-binding-like beta-propeller repeat protein [Pirellulaceae bacterium]